MYICNTKNYDVMKAIKHMRDAMSLEEINGLRTRNDTLELPIILQVSMVRYRRLKTITSQQEMKMMAQQRATKHFINPNTLTLHELGCRHIRDNFLKAVLTKPKLTGLPRCKRCMP